jgi:hypothetical protein
MGESSQGSDKHPQRLDDELVRDPSDDDATTEPQFWEAPGHDGIVGPDETDSDRTDLRSQIGQYVSLVKFPTTIRDLIAEVENRDAPDEVLTELRNLDVGMRFANTAELWQAMGLGSDRRF